MDISSLVSCRYSLEIQHSIYHKILPSVGEVLGTDPSPEWLKGDLQGGTRVWNLEFLENRGVQDADTTEFNVGMRA